MPVRIKMNTQAVKAAIRAAAQPRLTIAADHLRIHLAQELDNGSLPIHSDTQALSIGLSVATPQGSDSDVRTRLAGAAYVQGGKHTAGVRRYVDNTAYEQSHFDERVAPEEPLTGSGVRARVFTRLAYGAWWYWGHGNVFTRKYEAPRDWIEGPAVAWGRTNLAGYFKDLI